jgi:hypothetical protein
MASKIVIGLSTYLVDFDGGQSGLRTGDYVEYAVDLDQNFVTLRNTINTMIDEIIAVQGPNASLGTDILTFNDPVEHSPQLNSGIIGIHSYNTVIGTPTSQLEVDAGEALYDGVKVSWASKILTTGAGAGTYYVRLGTSGEVTLESSSNVKDIYSAVYNGSAFTSVTLLAGVDASGSDMQIFFDGDDYEAMLRRPVESPTWTAKRYTQFSTRMNAVEQLLAGLAVDDDSDAIGPHVHPDGTAGSPGVTFRGIQTLGWYRSSNDLNGATNGTLRVTISSTGVHSNVNGTAGDPSFSWVSDPDTGMYLIATNRLGFGTDDTLRMELDANGNVDLPTNARVQGNRTTSFTLTDAAAPISIPFTAADTYDIGNGTDNWHDHTSGDPTDEEFECPTGCDGTFHVVLEFEWASGADATNDCAVWVTKNGETIGTHDISQAKKRVVSGEDWSSVCSTYVTLSATDKIRGMAQVDTSAGSTMDLNNVKLSIHKVA